MTCQTPIVQSLRSEGVRMTPQREIILETLCHGRGHLTAEDVFAQVEGRLPGINIATVYRTLEMLRRAHVVSMVHGANGRAEFEVIHSDQYHHHLVCEACGRVLELDHEMLNELQEAVEARYGFVVGIQHLSFSGLCSDCRS